MEENRAGKPLNLSVASRGAQITTDRELVSRHDNNVIAAGKKFKIALVIFVLLIALTIYNFVIGHFWLGIISILVTAISALVTLVLRGLALGAVYESGLLVPAIVTSTNPIELTVLAEVSSTDDQSQLACKKLIVESLPLHDIALGEKVPCVALFGGMADGYYTNFDPRPLVWATANKDEITKNIELIDTEEWTFLDLVKDRVPQMKTNQIAYFDKDGNCQTVK